MLDDLELGEMFPDYGVMHGVRLLKHLAGQHDQTTHGRWADSGLPHELEDVRASLKPYFDAGLITGYNDVTKKDWWAPEPDARKPTGDNLDKGVSFAHGLPSAYGASEEHLKIIADAEEKMLGGNAEEIEAMAYEEARKLGMGERQKQYYAQGVVSRASLYVSLYNQMIKNEVAKKIYGDISYFHDKPADERQEWVDTRKKFFDNFDATANAVSKNLEKASPAVAIDAENLLKVIEDGRFKTQYETKASNGAYKPALRREAELAISGVPLDTKASERPIYGYLAMQETGKSEQTNGYNADRWNVNNHGVNQYGNVRVVFDDSVKQRTSYTMVDSLDRHALPQPLHRNDKKSLIMAGLNADATPSHEGLQREGYVEAQIYGGLKMKDVKKIYVTPVKKYDEEKGAYIQTLPEETVKRIKDALLKKGYDKIDVELIGMEELK